MLSAVSDISAASPLRLNTPWPCLDVKNVHRSDEFVINEGDFFVGDFECPIPAFEGVVVEACAREWAVQAVGVHHPSGLEDGVLVVGLDQANIAHHMHSSGTRNRGK